MAGIDVSVQPPVEITVAPSHSTEVSVNTVAVSTPGPKGEPGEPGKPFVYSDFTAEQLEGLKGPKGDPGVDGRQGEPGTPGRDGADGVPGAQGLPGRDGAPGVNGQDGQDGRTPEFSMQGTVLQWRYAGETIWKTLLDLKTVAPSTPSQPGGRVAVKMTVHDNGIYFKSGDDPERLLISLDALKGQKGEPGTPGAQGTPGAPGIGIADIVNYGDTTMAIVLSNGTRHNITLPRGKAGAPGTTDYNELQNKPDLTSFLTAKTGNNVAYVNNNLGAFAVMRMESDSIPNSIVMRDSNGAASFSLPTRDPHAATKGYVDQSIGEIIPKENRVRNAPSLGEETTVTGFRADKLAFIDPTFIALERSSDQGASWADMGRSLADMATLFTSSQSGKIALPKSSWLRVTLKSNAGGGVGFTLPIRTKIDSLYAQLDTSGGFFQMKVETSPQNDPDNYSTVVDWAGSIAGRDADAFVKLRTLSWGGDDYGRGVANIRVSFKQNNGSRTGYWKLYRLSAYGPQGGEPLKSNMASLGTLYSWDADQNATFPGRVSGDDPEDETDFATKKYVDSRSGGGSPTDITNAIKAYMLQAFPVGTILAMPTNPAAVLGGTWVETAKGRMLVGAGDGFNYGAQGGKKEHTLTVAQLPKIQGNFTHTSANDRASDGVFSVGPQPGVGTAGEGARHNGTPNTWRTHMEFGEGQPTPLMNPYEVTRFWKRTA